MRSAIAVTQAVVTPNMVRPERRLAFGRQGRRLRHAGDRLRGVRQDDAGQPVEPGHVGDRRHHDDVGDVDVRRDVAGGERRHHDLRQAERQAPHAGRDDRRAAAAADADDAGDIVAGFDEAREGLGHCGDRRAAIVAAEHGGSAVGVMAGDFGCRDVDVHRRPARADVDAQRRDAGGGDRIGEEGELVALGVRRADHVDAPAIILPARPLSFGAAVPLLPCASRARPLHFFETRVSY